ncbi:TPA: hypothetical protein NPP28_004428 [Klebsiella quasipneumoniae subsp. similipneumoniae]|uniref:hypothetical protein n=1 Tax=Klebsiella quasipneumoniae TaxID=1463165 RepID=UPI0038903BA7|nr:hypothetical protein [Klebsiella quasipneumoniae]HCI6595944.1 hypothetical protein [Klebsiella quasipneumoniae subsp. similipneumoniae]
MVNMFFFRVIVIAILFPALISCTTQKALNETGKEIDKGHYGVATWYVATLPVVMLYDVFTLGGTSDPQTGYNTVVSVANKQPVTQSAHSSSGTRPQSTIQTAAGGSVSTVTTPQNVALRTASSQGPSSVSSSVKSYPPADNCLTRDSTSNSLADFWINHCGFAVTVMLFDANDCRTGCMDGVGANSRQSITKGRAGSAYTSVACPKPSTPKGPDGIHQWANEGHHQCTS